MGRALEAAVGMKRKPIAAPKAVRVRENGGGGEGRKGVLWADAEVACSKGI